MDTENISSTMILFPQTTRLNAVMNNILLMKREDFELGSSMIGRPQIRRGRYP